MEKRNCQRCGTYTYLETHHILPRVVFLGLGPVIYLCPNCHNEYHKALGAKNIKNTDPDYHQHTFWKWYYTLSVIIFALVGIIALFKAL